MEVQTMWECFLRIRTILCICVCALAFTIQVNGTTMQRIDGWYNNLGYPNWGTAGEPLTHNISTAYDDFTYQCVKNNRPGARQISNEVFRQNMSQETGGSINNRSALFAFFGQMVGFELTDTSESTCPVELMPIEIPKCDPDFDLRCTGSVTMPFQRSAYDKGTGQSPNTPRRQINSATSYIDGSFVYGTSTVRASFLRKENSEYLASEDNWGKYPEKNDIRLPYKIFPTVNSELEDPERLWKLGDLHAHENPAVLSLGVLFFKWHNVLAKRFSKEHPDWPKFELFTKARRWVIASLQNIIMYEWLPKLLNKDIPPYSGYKSFVDPGVTAVFDAIGMKYLMTLIPAGIAQRQTTCKHVSTLRLCNSYFNSQSLLTQREDGVEETLLGLATQKAEKDDYLVIEDLQSKWYGPLHFSRRDHVALTIMRGRDYGIPDYNTVRQQVGLAPVTDWEGINPNITDPQLIDRLKLICGDIKNLDAFVGGMLETTDNGPGELVSNIILNQFERIRDGDRFWFENEQQGHFTKQEIAEIRNISLHDIIVESTKIMPSNLQRDVFTVHSDDPCKLINVNINSLEKCISHQGYDYFAGSEISYIIIWTCFGLIPFVCVLLAYIAAKCRGWRYNREIRRRQLLRGRNENNDTDAEANGTEVTFHAWEWLGEKEEPRRVAVKLKQKCQLQVNSTRGTKLRTVNLDFANTIDVWVSTNKRRTTLMIKVPKEYDLVLQFQNFAMRGKFENNLKEKLAVHNRQIIVNEVKVAGIYEKAFTQKKRNAVLEKFFKSVFSEAFKMDYDPNLEEGGSANKQAEEILEIELTKDEFAQAMACKPNSEFVENMFKILDSDRNGYISFRDFLNAVVLFSKGSCQEKLMLVFRMFDLEGDGCLHKEQLIKMFSSLLEMANSNLGRQDIENLVESICSQNGLDDQSSLNFEDFCQILSPQMDKIWNAGLEWKGRKNCYPSQDRKKSGENGRRKSLGPSLENGRRKNSVGSEELLNQRNGSIPNLVLERRTRFEAIREKYHPVKAKMKDVHHFVENNRQHIFYLVLFYGICVALFAERFYYYTVENEHSGLRTLMSYGISVTRGAAAVMSFTFSLLLLTMCRNFITSLRGTFLNLYIPFDSHVAFHKVVAWTALFFTAMHVIGYSFNFYQIATQPTGHLCIFDSIVLRSDAKLKFEFWLFGNMTGFTGVLLVIIICIIYVFATQTARRFIFNGFWLTHKLIVIMYILTILHGASIIVQKPLFFVYFTVPAILFTIDKMISLSRKKTEITVLRAEKLPSDITFLEFKRPSKFEYKSGQWVRIACLSHGRNEYHPFTLTSAPHEDTLSLHIRALGPWTWNIRHHFDPENLKDVPYPKLYLDGPYGAGQQDWYQYEVSVLVGAGIGVTPYASILKDFVHMAMMRSTYRMKCQKLYFVWVTASQRHYEWLLDIIREVEEVDEKGIVSIDIFITQFFQNFDLRTAMLYICEEHFQKLSGGCSVFTGLKAKTHFGRPKLNEMFQAVNRAHPMVKKVGVFSCGPPGVTKSVEQGCIEASNSTKAMFEHHFENF